MLGGGVAPAGRGKSPKGRASPEGRGKPGTPGAPACRGTKADALKREAVQVKRRLVKLVHGAQHEKGISLLDCFSHFNSQSCRPEQFQLGLANLGIACGTETSRVLCAKYGNDRKEIDLAAFQRFVWWRSAALSLIASGRVGLVSHAFFGPGYSARLVRPARTYRLVTRRVSTI